MTSCTLQLWHHTLCCRSVVRQRQLRGPSHERRHLRPTSLWRNAHCNYDITRYVAGVWYGSASYLGPSMNGVIWGLRHYDVMPVATMTSHAMLQVCGTAAPATWARVWTAWSGTCGTIRAKATPCGPPRWSCALKTSNSAALQGRTQTASWRPRKNTDSLKETSRVS